MTVLRAPDVVFTIKPIAVSWVASARAALAAPSSELCERALAVNFASERAKDAAELRAKVIEHFAAIDRVLAKSAELFCAPWPWDVRKWFGASVPPAYAYDGHVYFTDEFRTPFVPAEHKGFGPKCLAAMIVHECVHVFDARSGAPEIHVSEWDEPRFSAIAPELQVHNPSAYASFAAQVHHGALAWPRDARYGAGRRAD